MRYWWFPFPLTLLCACPLTSRCLAASELPADVGEALLEERWDDVQSLVTAGNANVADPVSRMLVAQTCLATGQYNQAAVFLLMTGTPECLQAWDSYTEGLLAQHPDQPVALYVRADARARLGDLKGAQGLLSQVVEQKPNWVLAMNALAVAYALDDQLNQALDQLAIARGVDPTCAATHANIGWVTYLARAVPKNPDAPIIGFDDALALDPTLAAALNGRGCLRFAAGKYDLAMSDFEAARLLCPALPGLAANRAHAEASALWVVQAEAEARMGVLGPGTTIHAINTRLDATLRIQTLSMPQELRGLDWAHMERAQVEKLIDTHGFPLVDSAMSLRRTELSTDLQDLYARIIPAIRGQKTSSVVSAYAGGVTAAFDLASAANLARTFLEGGFSPFLGAAALESTGKIPNERIQHISDIGSIGVDAIRGDALGLGLTLGRLVSSSVDRIAQDVAGGYGVRRGDLVSQRTIKLQELTAIDSLQQSLRTSFTPDWLKSVSGPTPPIVDLSHRAYFTSTDRTLNEVPAITDMVANSLRNDLLPRRVGIWAPDVLSAQPRAGLFADRFATLNIETVPMREGTLDEARRLGISAIVGVKPEPIGRLRPLSELDLGSKLPLLPSDWSSRPMPSGFLWQEAPKIATFSGPESRPGGVALSMQHALVDAGNWPVVAYSTFLYELTAFAGESAEPTAAENQ